MEKPCVRSCKGLCNALTVAEHHEEEMIKEYRMYASQCDYPDVRQLLEELIADRERGIRLIREKRDMLTARFATTDSISESFS